MIETSLWLAPALLFISGLFQLRAWGLRQKGFYQDQEEIRGEVLDYRQRKNIHWWTPVAMARSNNLANVFNPSSRIETKALQNYATQPKAMSWEAMGWSTLIMGSGIATVLALIAS